MADKRTPARDAFGLTIDARELPARCKPPYRGESVWQGTHRSWRIYVTRIPGDPLLHVVASGMNPATGRWEAHAERQDRPSPRSVKEWVDGLLNEPGLGRCLDAGGEQAEKPADKGGTASVAGGGVT